MTLKPITRKTDIVVQELDAEVLIYDLTANKAYCLNETAGIIWQLCDGTKTINEISQASGKKLNSNISEDFVWLALEQFRKDKLVANDFENFFEGMTRREVIRRIGFASVVSLPIVASIVAPISANAQSACIPFSNSCSPPGMCCPGSICVGSSAMTCTCMCVNPGQCLTQTSCPSTVNCNGSGVCAP